MNRKPVITTFLVLLSLQTGCASSLSGVDALWQKEGRYRTLACFNHHSDQRYLIGSGPVWAACKRWATSEHRQTLGGLAAP